MLNAIIVDDEKLARDEMKFLLEKCDGIKIVAEASNVAGAIQTLNEAPCDVMFLDINMPDASGLDLAGALRSLQRPPFVVFVSAYSEYGVDAFGVKATDYLLKPVELERLKVAIETVQENVSLRARVTKNKKITCEHSGKKIYLKIDDVRYCVARDDYAYVDSLQGKLFCPKSLSSLEKDLEGYGFMRVHRSYVVNMKYVYDLINKDGGSFLRLKDVDEQIPVSRRRVSEIKKLLDMS